MRTPIVVTTLEEDFRKIGLIKESAPAPAPAAAPASEEDETVLDEAGRIKFALRGGKKVAQHKTSMADRLAAKKERRSAGGRKSARKQAKMRRTSKGQRHMAKVQRKAIQKGTRQEDVAVDPAEQLKSFANAAIIADKLASIFTEWVKADEYEAEDERMFAGLVGSLSEIAESFADIATAMSEGKLEESTEDVAAAFAEGMEVILDAVELYEDNNEDDDDDKGDEGTPSGNG